MYSLLLNDMQLRRYKACKSGEELRQDVMQNDIISLSDVATEGGGKVYIYQKGAFIHQQLLIRCGCTP